MGILDFLFGNKPQQAEKSEPYYVATELKGEHTVTSTEHLTGDQIVDYFRNILATEYPELTIKESVPVTDMVGDVTDTFTLYESRPHRAYKAEWGIPYTFVAYSGEELKFIIMIGGPKSHISKVKYLISRMYAKKMGVPYLGFYTDLENDIRYVVHRINKVLGKQQ